MEASQLRFNEKERRFLLSSIFPNESAQFIDVLATFPGHTQAHRAVQKAIQLLCGFAAQGDKERFWDFQRRTFYRADPMLVWNELDEKIEEWETPNFARWEPKKLGDLAKEIGEDMEKVRQDLTGKKKIAIEFDFGALEEGRRSWEKLRAKLEDMKKEASFMHIKEPKRVKAPKVKCISGLSGLGDWPMLSVCDPGEARTERFLSNIGNYSTGGYMPFWKPENHCGWEPRGDVDFTKMFWEDDWIYLTYNKSEQ